MWFIIGLIDTIIKGLEYGAIFLIPLIIAIIVISIKKVNNYKKIRKIILILIVALLLSSRIWGPPFFKILISIPLENQTSSIEKQLEEKYNKNFTFLSKGKTQYSDKYVGSALGQDIIYDYEITYTFKDDDGVPAIVKYKLGSGWDYYQLRRAEYEIEQTIYDYARVNGITNDFYVKCINNYESIIYDRLEDIEKNNFIEKEMSSSNIYFVTPNSMDESIISRALYQKYPSVHEFSIYEYVLTNDEYQRFKDYYKDYSYTIHDTNEYKINEENILNYKYR